MIRFKKSRIMAWRKCPRQYSKTWPDVLGRSNTEIIDPSVEMQFGKMFHEKANQFFVEVDIARAKVLDFDALMDYFSAWKINHPVVGPWMDNFLKFEAHQALIWRARPYRFEEVWKPWATEYEIINDEVELHVDRIDLLPIYGTYIAVEYKTGKTFNIHDMRYEMTFYSVWLNKYLAPKRFTHIGMYNPQLDKTWNEPVNSHTLGIVTRDLPKFSNNHTTGRFEPHPTYLCMWCKVPDQCLDEGIV